MYEDFLVTEMIELHLSGAHAIANRCGNLFAFLWIVFQSLPKRPVVEGSVEKMYTKYFSDCCNDETYEPHKKDDVHWLFYAAKQFRNCLSKLFTIDINGAEWMKSLRNRKYEAHETCEFRGWVVELFDKGVNQDYNEDALFTLAMLYCLISDELDSELGAQDFASVMQFHKDVQRLFIVLKGYCDEKNEINLYKLVREAGCLIEIMQNACNNWFSIQD